MDINEIKVSSRKRINERRAARRAIENFTDYSVKNRACMGIITNISPMGAFIESLDIFETGEIVKIVIKCKNGKIKRTGIIKWSNQRGFGLQFTKP